MDLVTENGSEALTRDREWWGRAEVLPPDTDYRFTVDGGEPLPDPRSPCQPSGPHGPSRTIDHSAFEWNDAGWKPGELGDQVIYECHVGTFTPDGTFDAAIAKLPHLVDLGVTALELMPVAEFPGERGWGYDGVDLFAPHHSHGGPDGLKRLVDAAHTEGLAVILDVVYNHLGPDGNYLARFGPYFTDRYGTPWGQAVNFDDAHSDEVRRFVVDNALMWLRDYHCDGLRVDAIHAIFDGSALHILEQMKNEVEELQDSLERNLWVIAESDLNDPRVVAPRARGGYGLDAQWSDDFHHALHTVLTGETSGYYADFGRLEHLAKALRNAFVYDGIRSPYRRRVHGRSPAGLPGHRFLAYAQNHDQVGNRARGDRSSALMSPGLLKVAAAIVMTSPFVPMLFQGEEWGASTPFPYFTDHTPELGALVSKGRKEEFAAFGWNPDDIPDPQDPATFEAAKLRWEEPSEQPHEDLLQWHKDLIRLRRTTPELRDGRMEDVGVDYDEGARWIVVRRGPLTIACNLSPAAATVPRPIVSPGRIVLASAARPNEASATVELPPASATIYSTEE